MNSRSLGVWSLPCVALIAAAACKSPTEKPSEGYAAQPAPPPSAPANGSHLSEAEVLAFVNPQNLPVYSGPTGSIEGTITITGDPSPNVEGLNFHKCLAGREVYEKLFRVGATRPDGARTLGDALVAVTGYGSYFIPERNPARTVTFDNCALDLRTIDMTIGQRLDVASKADLLFAPILAQAPAPALMLVSKNTAAVSLYPPKPGYYTLNDRMELTYLRADVYTMLQPLHTVTTLDGHYRIDGIPVGKVTVNTRLARIRKEASRIVDVEANKAQTVDLTLEFKLATDVPKEPPVNRGSLPIP
jgi:hypothetical protein